MFDNLFEAPNFLGITESPTPKAEIILMGLDADFEYTTITCNRTGKVKYRKED